MIWTEDELLIEITDVKAAIKACLLGKSYRLNTGQSQQEVTRESLPELRKYLKELEGELISLREGNINYMDMC